MTRVRTASAASTLGLAVAASSLLAGCAAPDPELAPPPGESAWAIATVQPHPSVAADAIERVLGAEVPSLCGAQPGRLVDGALPSTRPVAATTISPQGTPEAFAVADDIRIAEGGPIAHRYLALAEDGNVVLGAAAAMSCEWSGRADRERILAWSAELAPLAVIELRPLDPRGAPEITALAVSREVVRAEWEVRGPDGARIARMAGSFRWNGASFAPEGVGEAPASTGS